MGDQETVLASEMEKWWLRAQGRRFIDVTEYPDLGKVNAQNMGVLKVHFPALEHGERLKEAYEHVSDAGPRADLAKFTSFYTRYYRSESGRRSQRWLMDQVEGLADHFATNTSISEFKHDWEQRTIILRIGGANASRTAERGVTILGAHQDSTSFLPFLRSPGADDDGSGTVTLLETLRALGASRWVPESDVEFHFYSAEEGGLLGSQAVASAYEQDHVRVQAMLQQDMTAFVKRGTTEKVGIVTDYTSPALTDFVTRLVDAYLDIPYVRTKTNYGASDHASWDRAGYPSAFAIEAAFEDCNLQNIHTSRDTFDHDEFSFPHILQFVRLSMAFVVELSGWA